MRVRVEIVEQGAQPPDSGVVGENVQRGLLAEALTPEFARGEDAAVALFRQGQYDAVASDDRRFVRRLQIQGVPYVTPGVQLYLLARDGHMPPRPARQALARLAPMVSAEETAVVKLKLEALDEGDAH